MEAGCQEFKSRILVHLDLLESELHRMKSDWELRQADASSGGYVFRENLNVFEEELSSVRRTRELIEAMDCSLYSKPRDFKARIISELEDIYDSSVLLRSGLAIILNMISHIDDETDTRSSNP